MKLIQRGGMWWVEFRLLDGKRKRLSTSVPLTSPKVDAERAAEGIVKSAMTPPAELTTLGQLLERTFVKTWAGGKSEKVMRHMVDRLVREIGAWRLDEVKFKRLEDYCEEMKSQGYAPATINRRMSTVSVALTSEARRTDVARIDVPHYKENNKRERYMSDAEEAAVLNWLDRKVASDKFFGTGEWDFMRGLFIVLIDTGMRFSETFVAVEVNGTLRLPHGGTKSGKARSIPLTSRAREAWAVLAGSPHMAAMRDSANPWAWADHRWKQAVAGGGCADITLHILRHTCASRLVQRGVPLLTVKAWLGHSSVVMTERYAHLATDSLSGALSALEGRPVAVPSEPQAEPLRASR